MPTFNVIFEGGYVDITRRNYPFPAERVSQELQARSGYGIGKSFWDAAAFVEASERQELEAKIDTAKSLAQTDEGRAALKALLSSDSFNLPPAPTGE